MSAIDPICLQLPADYGEMELSFGTAILGAEKWGCAVRDPGLPHAIEMIVFRQDIGQWALIAIEPRRALSLAESLIKMAALRL